MSSINFDNPFLLFIAIPLVVLLCVPFVIAVRRDNVNGHNVTSAVLHVIMALLIAFTAAGTKIVTVVTQTDVYVLADVSYSASRNLDTVDDYIEDLSKNLPNNSRLGVICFGKDYKLLTRLGESLKSVKEANVDDSGTDIVSALNYAGSIFRDGVIKRIVLITDGKQSDESDPNALKRAVDALNADNIRIDAIYLNDNITETSREVQIENAEFSPNVYLNHDESVTAAVRSCYETQALVSLYKQDEKISERAVSLTNGVNYVTFSLDTSVEATFNYEIRVQAEGDGNPNDNCYKFSQTVSGVVNVLLVSDKYDDFVALRNIYGDSAVIDYVSSYNVPCSIEELCAFDEIVISDTDVSSFNNYEMFIESVDKVVSLFGKSLITMGDVGLLNKTDEGLKPLGNILPIKFGNSELDPRLYTFVIDCSRSMKESSYLDIAKKTACMLVDMLNDDDEVCIIRFDGEAQNMYFPNKASNREEIKQIINGLEVKQGTLIGNGLEAAYNAIKNLSFSNKHVLLISDGINYSNEVSDAVGIVRDMYHDGIFTSSLYVGKQDSYGLSQEVTNAKQLLKNIAKVSDNDCANYYEIYSLDEVDSIVLDQIAPQNNEEKLEGGFYDVIINKRFDAVVEGVTDARFIRGYLNTSSKASATTVLTVEYKKENGTSDVPLYSYWQYGNGKVSSFTSNLSGDWISSWNSVGLDKTFFSNMFDVNTPSVKSDYPFLVTTTQESGYCSVEVTPATIRPDAVAEISVTRPDGEVQSGNLAFNSARYIYNFSTPDTGKYVVNIKYSYGGYEYTVESSFYVSYLSEYDSFATYDASVLHKMVGGNGIVSEDGKLAIENDENDVGVRIVSLSVPMMIACVALFAVDIIIRKLKWNDIKSLFVKVNK